MRTRPLWYPLRWSLVLILASSWTSTAPADLVIAANFVDGGGETWDNVRRGVVNQAVSDWMSVLKGVDDGNGGILMPTINIDFTFDAVGGLAAADSSVTAIGGATIRPWLTAGVASLEHTITFNTGVLSGDNFLWFDPTPDDDGSDKPFEAWDAVSTARHEIGHVLGFNTIYDNTFNTNDDPWTALITGNVFDPSGLAVPMEPGDPSHLSEALTSPDLMDTTQSNIDGRLPITATHFQMLQMAYSYTNVPEPSAALFLGLIGGMAGMWRVFSRFVA